MGIDKPGAVIVGGHFHSLGAARSLARRGIEVCVLDRDVCVAQYSRYVDFFVRCPPTSEEEGFVEFLVRVAAERHLDGWVLFPSDDESVRVIAQHRERLGAYYRVATPVWDVVRYAYDKRLTHRLAVELGIPVPRTIFGI